MKYNILIVEDNRNVSKSIETGLQEAGYTVTSVGTMRRAEELCIVSDFDLIILDLGLPDGNGNDLLQLIRKSKRNTKVIILTARDSIDDCVKGFEDGADDYMIKPFIFAELLARVRARLRLTHTNEQAVIRIGNLEIDRLNRTVCRGGKPIELTTREFDLLSLLANSAGFPVSRDTLAKDVWKISNCTTSINNVIDVHVSHLREKIDGLFENKLIHTVRGVGFMIKEK